MTVQSGVFSLEMAEVARILVGLLVGGMLVAIFLSWERLKTIERRLEYLERLRMGEKKETD